ncbi:hypothetical protein DQ04_07021020 [Trypanosoma grayi]|uniref:hypothetical protein n=1 Tax=Trypanosoma grayi TaxID=71804 RepID=UPI0004F47526|nr:hypothetical protein DQ04_07021020 [Trypanosoma grayi]KEG08507.1 hypothetical protein DQ04_07021020 [Trypanosoma grayi]
MPANKTYRQGVGKQRHHKHRVGRMLVPHGRVSGLLFTVNPRQESRALRELQLYLHPLIADLEKAEAEAEEEEKAKGGLPQGNEDNQPTPAGDGEAEKAAAPSTSSLLAAELAAYVPARPSQHKETKTTAREEDDDSPSASGGDEDGEGGAPIPARKRQRPDDDDNAADTRRAKANCRRWLAPLETGCKGHMMVSIPFPPQMEATAEEKATATGAAEPSSGEREATETPAPHDGTPGSGNNNDDDNNNTEAPPPAEEGSTPRHTGQRQQQRRRQQ